MLAGVILIFFKRHAIGILLFSRSLKTRKKISDALTEGVVVKILETVAL